jgi:hypothetical protein
MAVLYRAIAVLALLSGRVEDFITYVRSVVQKMTGNANFPSPNPTLAAVTTAVDALDAAQVKARGRIPGAAAARDAQFQVVRTLLEYLKRYVQQVADANPALARNIILGAGFGVKKDPPPRLFGFRAEPGDTSGSVQLVAPAAGPASSYHWGMSTDGKSFTMLPSTVQASTMVYNLTPGTTYWFRYRPVTRKGEGDWSQIFSLIVK